MPDLIVSASVPAAGIAIVAAITTDLVREVRERLDLSPTATAAVGRLVTGAALFGSALKGRERITLRVNGEGPIGNVTADAWLFNENTIGARGYADRPFVDLPLNERGKFDVAGAVGAGTLQVTKSFEIGQPYNGVVPLHSGEIAEDLAAYLVNSEQIPSVIALGVLADPDGIRAAGGILAQVRPDADDRAVEKLEARARALPPVTTLISQGAGVWALIAALAGDLELRSQRSLAIRFACLCTAEKVESALLALGTQELQRMATERNETDATCEFCKKRYAFSPEELLALAQKLESTSP